jgi:hypothetical protein
MKVPVNQRRAEIVYAPKPGTRAAFRSLRIKAAATIADLGTPLPTLASRGRRSKVTGQNQSQLPPCAAPLAAWSPRFPKKQGDGVLMIALRLVFVMVLPVLSEVLSVCSASQSACWLAFGRARSVSCWVLVGVPVECHLAVGRLLAGAGCSVVSAGCSVGSGRCWVAFSCPVEVAQSFALLPRATGSRSFRFSGGRVVCGRLSA